MNIPEDIWKYEIYSYLDYDSRIRLNQILSPTSRGYKKISKIKFKKHAASTSAKDIIRRLSQINNLDPGWPKTILILDFFKFIRKPLFQHVFNITSFRNNFLVKCMNLYNCKLIYRKEAEALNEEIMKAREIVGNYNENFIKCKEFLNVCGM
jgi:hypothetical protein